MVAAAGNVLFQNTYTLLIHFSALKNNIQFATFSLTSLEVLMVVVVAGVGVVTCLSYVHSATATKCSGNAQRLPNCTIYILTEYLFCIASLASAMLHWCNHAVSADSTMLVTSLANLHVRGWPLPPTCHTRRRQRLHILIYKRQTPANTQSQLTATVLLLPTTTLPPCLCCTPLNNTWAPSIRGRRL